MSRPEKEPETELAKRLRSVRKAFGDLDRASFSRKLGLQITSLRNYERGLTEPPASIVAAYGAVSGVSFDWLLTGRGQMFGDARPFQEGILNPDAMKTAINAVEEVLDGRPFKRKAELILACYDLIVADQSEENMAKVIKLIKAAA